MVFKSLEEEIGHDELEMSNIGYGHKKAKINENP